MAPDVSRISPRKESGQRPLPSAATPDQVADRTMIGSEQLLKQPDMSLSSSMQQLPVESLGVPHLSDVDAALLAMPATLPFDNFRDDGAFVDGPFDPEYFDLEPDVFYSAQNNSCGFIPNSNIIDEVDRKDFKMISDTTISTPMSMSGFMSFGGTGSSSFWPPEGQQTTSRILTDEREHEMAFLVRHFAEQLGPWMDLFDIDKHFSQLVPLKALRDALLRNAIAAVAAKQLGRVKGDKPFSGRQCQRPSTMETLDDVAEVDWFYKAANYYDKAIAFSRIYLEALSGTLSRPSSPNMITTTSVTNSDDLLVAVSIFSLYESLDSREMGWLRHLAGLKTLLTAISVKQQGLGLTLPSYSAAHNACFWNFARADHQAAYINRQKTHLDPDDLDMWRSCGLQVQDNGALYTDLIDTKSEQSQCRQTVQLVAHTLIYLVLRVVNYLAQDSEQEWDSWNTLNCQLELWYGNLPMTFRPCAQIRHRHQSGAAGTQLTEVFYSMETCAASIQLYHFARILLLVNKPRERTGVSRLKAYREVSSEALKHAREIIGIALGRPTPAVRVEMLLPLYVAGGCLEADDERRTLVEIMRAIEKDTGCSTSVTVNSLESEWGWNEEPKGVD
ncbi:hypothetical protein LTR17_024578 [Elasticomyces elasticus]|nr:hypothetical protein LTR17_024578 [Elasticomyces elasticus]